MNDQNKPSYDDNEIERTIDHALGQHDSKDHYDTDDSLLIEMEIAAALLDLSVAATHPVDMPESLVDRLKAQVAQYPDRDDSNTTSSSVSEQSNPTRWVPWMVAAAALFIATVSIFMPRGTQGIPDLNSQRLALIQSAPADELTQWDWISTGDAAVVGDVIGDVVWSDTLNKGYMRISGLAVNDPSLEQYQLWIFDATRPTGELPQFGEGLLTQRPIDGGVFDVSETGEVIIEIDAKLFVQTAAAFAITVEPPGGVVVSDRSRVPLLALAP